MLKQINPFDNDLTMRESMVLVRLLEKYRQYTLQERPMEAKGVGTAALMMWKTIKSEPINQTGYGALT